MFAHSIPHDLTSMITIALAVLFSAGAFQLGSRGRALYPPGRKTMTSRTARATLLLIAFVVGVAQIVKVW